MKDKINTYFAVLIITIIGAVGAQLIVHAAYSNQSDVFYSSKGGQYAALQESILSH